MSKSLVREIGIGLLHVAGAVIIGASIGGLLFSGLDWLRTFGATNDSPSVARNALSSLPNSPNPTLGLIAAVIEWYSSTFFGYSRFGSGLGILVGCFWSMDVAIRGRAVTRIIVGFVTGFAIGFRCAIFVVSQPHLVLICSLLGGTLTAFYIFLAGRKSAFSSLPRLQFKHQP